MNRYRVKVTEIHSDYVWVDAETKAEAVNKAIPHAACAYERLHSAEAILQTENTRLPTYSEERMAAEESKRQLERIAELETALNAISYCLMYEHTAPDCALDIANNALGGVE